MSSLPTRVCLNCQSDFTIAAEDSEFYEKIKVPAPKWCPDCRTQRRYAWRNERVLYRRNCDLCHKDIVTIYSPNKPFKVYCPTCWWSDDWNALDYGQDFDFTRPFFEQWRQLQLQVPRIALLTKNSVNSDYTNHSSNNKNCYMGFTVFGSENILYSTNIWKPSKDCCDCYLASDEGGAELVYECLDSYNIYNCQFCVDVANSSDCYYCYDLHGCSDCFLSYNLRNKQYYYLNKSYSKEEYEKLTSHYRLGSFAAQQELQKIFLSLMRDSAVHVYAHITKSEQVTGNRISGSKNARQAFDADKMENTKYTIIVAEVKDSYDLYHCGFTSELLYESHALSRSYNVRFCHLCYDNSELQYCDSCHDSSNLFSCVGLKNAKFCILNKQYEEKEFDNLADKIIKHMRETGEYGEFFPPQLSPFGYNETTGHTYMPLTKDQVLQRGWLWEDLKPGTFGKGTIKSAEIPDAIEDVSERIMKEVLDCVDCGRNYTIISQELDLYRKMKIPVPRHCPDCRHQRRLQLRLPRQLWRRTCSCVEKGPSHFHGDSKCSNMFETPYAPEREEKVYCRSCYLAEVG